MHGGRHDFMVNTLEFWSFGLEASGFRVGTTSWTKLVNRKPREGYATAWRLTLGV